MPQLFQVLRCYKCLVFQVHQTKKSKKWECKLCGEKQSVKRYYGLGTAKDCRLHVQKLNAIRGETNELKSDEDDTDDATEYTLDNVNARDQLKPETSKWSEYGNKAEEISEEKTNETMYLGNTEVVLEIPKKRQRILGKSNNLDKNRFTVPRKQTNEHEKEDLSDTVVPRNKNVTNALNTFTKIDMDDSAHLQREAQKSLVCMKKPNIVLQRNNTPMKESNSKWAQFVEKDSNDENELSIEKSPQGNPQTLLFSLCDDSDLDNVLDI